MGGLVQPGTPARSPRLRPTSRVRGRPHRHLTPREPANPGPRNQLGTKPGVLQSNTETNTGVQTQVVNACSPKSATSAIDWARAATSKSSALAHRLRSVAPAREECPAQHRYVPTPDAPGSPLCPRLCGPPAPRPRPKQCALSARTPPPEPTGLVPQNNHPHAKTCRSGNYPTPKPTQVSKLRFADENHL